ncbi:MAG: chemotaxis protein [Mycobacterium sp.]|nr:MAG: chemotaxis protein [Mycobacterium sp.]
MGGRAAAAVSRDDSASDVELAKMAVAELAGASCVVDAGLDWAVTVGHNGSGGTTLWVATNDGACYIPPGVFLRNGMSVAAGFDEDFDARWLGWSNPAEKAVRAARAYGDKVGAVATTWAWPSEFLEDPDEGVRQVAIGVPHAGPDGPASELRRTRMHRLQTVSPGLYGDLKALDEAAVRGYCRELVRRVVFGGGPELSPVAQAVAHALVAGGWPKAEEWSALSAEYDAERLMMAAQRPGLNGLEDPAQVVSYHNCFINCRRLEMLLCWKRSDPLMAADVVYAASVAGVRVPILHYVC